MIFVTADSCRPRLEQLTRRLISAFPGSTIYQHTELGHVPHDVLNFNVDVVILAAEPEAQDVLVLAKRLRRQKPEIPLFILSQTNALRENAAEVGASGFVLPEEEQDFLDAIRTEKARRV